MAGKEVKKPSSSPRRTGKERILKSGGSVDFRLVVYVMILVLFGLLMLFSASQNVSRENIYAIFTKQAKWAVIGTVIMFFSSKLDYHIYKKLSFLIFGAVMLLMAGVSVMGISSHGATRQIELGGANLQPSEFCKFAVVILFAALLSGKKLFGRRFDEIDIYEPPSGRGVMPFMKALWRYVKKLLPYLAVIVIVALSCIAQSHLSALIIIGGTGVIMLIAAGLHWGFIVAGGLAAVLGVILMIAVEPYRIQRVKALFDPYADPLDGGYQVIQSLYAVGSGGLFGRGFGNSIQKYGYLPEAQNDYIFAIVCEELGFIGGIAVIGLFTALVFRGIRISAAARDRFGMYLGFGISAIIALQMLINVGVVLSVVPSTGMQLPFFSSGGSAMVVMMWAMGVLMNISRSRKKM